MQFMLPQRVKARVGFCVCLTCVGGGRLSVVLCPCCQLMPASWAAQHQLQCSAELPSLGSTTAPMLQTWAPLNGYGGSSV